MRRQAAVHLLRRSCAEGDVIMQGAGPAGSPASARPPARDRPPHGSQAQPRFAAALPLAA